MYCCPFVMNDPARYSKVVMVIIPPCLWSVWVLDSTLEPQTGNVWTINTTGHKPSLQLTAAIQKEQKEGVEGDDHEKRI